MVKQKIIEIIESYEEYLSDGFCFYVRGHPNVCAVHTDKEAYQRVMDKLSYEILVALNITEKEEKNDNG